MRSESLEFMDEVSEAIVLEEQEQEQEQDEESDEDRREQPRPKVQVSWTDDESE